MLHTKYERSRLSGFREEDFLRLSYEKLISPGCGHFWPGGHNLNKLSRGPLGIQNIKTLGFVVSEKKIF